MSISLLHIATFIAVAEAGSMSVAAERLAFSVSTVSGHVSTLERQLRIALFERTGRGVVVTPAGRQALSLGRTMLGCQDSLSRIGVKPSSPPAPQQPSARYPSGGATRRA